MTTTVKPLTTKAAVWHEFVTFTDLNQLVADSARILPSHAIVGNTIAENYFVFVEVSDDEETEAALLVSTWARAMDSTVEVYTTDAFGGRAGRRWYSACGSVAGIRLSVHSPMYDRTTP